MAQFHGHGRYKIQRSARVYKRQQHLVIFHLSLCVTACLCICMYIFSSSKFLLQGGGAD